MSQPNHLLAQCADMRGRGPQMFFALDTLSKPGSAIFHFVQFDTIELNNLQFAEGENIQFQTINMENDKRILPLAQCLNFGSTKGGS